MALSLRPEMARLFSEIALRCWCKLASQYEVLFTEKSLFTEYILTNSF